MGLDLFRHVELGSRGNESGELVRGKITPSAELEFGRIPHLIERKRGVVRTAIAR